MENRKILFVCTGNTCRSVLAQYYASRLAADAFPQSAKAPLALEFFSAGLVVAKDILQPAIVSELLKKEGIKHFSHKPEQISAEIAESAGLILSMTKEHKEAVIRLFPEAAAKTMTLMEYAGFGAEDLPDPYGRDNLFYLEVFTLIKSAIKAAFEKLKKM